jgi:hypothetical protein
MKREERIFGRSYLNPSGAQTTYKLFDSRRKMDNTLRPILITLLAVALGAALFIGGLFFGARRFAYSMVNGYGFYGNMMGGALNQSYSNTPCGYGPGMMSGSMMGSYGSATTSNKPISVEDARKVADAYLTGINDADLQLKEIMIFDNGGHATITEMSTGVGAFELLIDPVSLTAYPDFGPNIMWNLKYRMMSGNGYSGQEFLHTWHGTFITMSE